MGCGGHGTKHKARGHGLGIRTPGPTGRMRRDQGWMDGWTLGDKAIGLVG